jgi:hypothetical protein
MNKKKYCFTKKKFFGLFKFVKKNTAIATIKENLFEKKKDFFCFFICMGFFTFKQENKRKKKNFSQLLFCDTKHFHMLKPYFVFFQSKLLKIDFSAKTNVVMTPKEKHVFPSVKNISISISFFSKKKNYVEIPFFFEWFFL